MKICGECERYFKCKDIDLPEDSTYAEGCPNYTPIDEVITNFEDIASSPRKLAKFLFKETIMSDRPPYLDQDKCMRCCAMECDECILEWLNKPKKKKEEVT